MQRHRSAQARQELLKGPSASNQCHYALELKKAVKNYRDLDNPDVQKQTHEKETAQAVVETAKNREAANKEQANKQPAGPAARG